MLLTTRRALTGAILIGLALCTTAEAQYAAEDEHGRYFFIAEFGARSWAVEKVLPLYPDEALKKSATGTAVVRVRINGRGEVTQVKVPPGINPLFRKAAVVAAKQWKFELPAGMIQPAKDGYLPIFRLTFNFSLQDDGAGRVEMHEPPWNSREHGLMRVYDKEPALKEWHTWADATDDN